DAIAFLLEGMLGGDGSDTPKLAKKGLSAPQRAFIDRIAGTIVGGLSVALAKSVGLSLTKLPELVNERSGDGMLVQLSIDFRDTTPKVEEKREFSLDDFNAPSTRGDKQDSDVPTHSGKCFGTAVIAVSKTALNVARAANQSKKVERIDPRVASTMRNVEVDVVAELGRLRVTLGELAHLRVGDTLRLDVPVNGDVELRIASQVVFKGQPTTVGSQLAVQIVETRGPEYPLEPPPPRSVDSTPPERGAPAPLRR
ncbi:MAG: FliM/FliN family flagellar motor switch protein, partial [Deltaproteobacteria bacterium]|nr:FliM/FliN family flagellar motor switch protein [Deltaproteobacteria bacterium]